MGPGSSRSDPSSPSSVPDLAWEKRARVVVGPTHRRRIWESRCGRYRVVHSRCLYGPRKGPQAIPDTWYAMKLVVVSGNVCWEVVSRHRQRGPAVRSCERDAKNVSGGARFCDRCGLRVATHFGIRTLFDDEAGLCDRCWTHFCRYSRPSRTRMPGQASGTRRKPRPSPDQLAFAFSHDTSD